MTLIDRLLPQIAWEGEGAGGGGSPAADGAPAGGNPAAPETVLFPNEGEKKEGDGAPASDAPAGEKAEGKPEDGKPSADDVVPEDGKYELTMPEGVEVDKELSEALGPQFKELGLTKAQAQKLVDKYIEVQQKRAEEQAKAPENMWSMAAYQYFKQHGTPDQWVEKAQKDPEIGGAKWDETKSLAIKGVKAFGTPELFEFLNASGGGNHPSVIKFMAKVGAMVKEDNPASGGVGGAGRPADPAHVLFPNDVPKG